MDNIKKIIRKIIQNLSLIAIIISILSMWVSYSWNNLARKANEIANKALDENKKSNNLYKEQNTHIKEGIKNNSVHYALEIIKEIKLDIGKLRVMEEMDKSNRDRDFTKHEVINYVKVLEALYNFYKEKKLTTSQIKDNFESEIEFWCDIVDDKISAYSYHKHYHLFYEMCQELDY